MFIVCYLLQYNNGLTMFNYVLVFLISALPLFAGVEYEIIPLIPNGMTPGGNCSDGNDLSESGYVVGSYQLGNGPVTRGFIYHPSTGFETIKGPQDKADLIVKKVNNNGTFIGYLNKHEWEECSCLMEYNVFVANSEGEMVVFDDGNSANPIGINDQETFLYSKWNSDEQKEIGIIENLKTTQYIDNPLALNNKGHMLVDEGLYSVKTGLQKIGSLDPYGRWKVTPVVLNECDVVAGYGYDVQDDQKGFIWDQEKGLRMIQTLGGEEIRINAINNHSQVVGSSKKDDDLSHAFIFDENFGTIDLGTLGGEKSCAKDINDHNQVVGYAETVSKLKGKRAFIWDSQGMRDLNDLISPNSGWKKLSKANQINNQGYIIGQGIYLGEEIAFLLIPINNQ